MAGKRTQVYLAQALKDFRGKETQEVFSARLSSSGFDALEGLRQQTYSGWETGSVPEPAVLVALADYFGVELRWLLTGQGAKRPRPLGEADRILDAIRRLVDPAHPGSDEAFRELAAWMEDEALPSPGEDVAGQGGQ